MPFDGGCPGFVGELCLALAHRLEPERLFMIYTAYFDESDTHSKKPDLIMAAFLGTVRQWELFERRLKVLQRRDGFQIFHATDFRNRRGEFAGWSEPKAERLISDLAKLISTGLTEGLTMTLPHALYESEYRLPPFPKGMHKDSQYGVCFRTATHSLLRIILADKKRHKLHVVIEDGHKNVQDTVRIFKELKAEYAAFGHDLLGTMTVAAKAEALPLMVADFQAYLSLLDSRLVGGGALSYDARAAAYPVPKGQAGLTTMQFTAEHLRGLKENWQQDRDARIAKWRATRDAKRASRASSTASLDDEGQSS